MEFNFLTAQKIIFKTGAVAEISKYVGEYGDNFLVVMDPFFAASPLLDQVKSQLDSINVKYTIYSQVAAEPTVEQADEVCELAIKAGCNAVISIGGGSNIDIGKSVAALITNGAPAIDYMEVVGNGRQVTKEPVPFIAIPTTAGTGSEVTKNAVLGSKVQTFKRSMRSDMMLANLVIADPELTRGCPPKVTANSGMDAMTHAIEAYLTWRATPVSDGLAIKAIELGGKYLKRCVDDGNDMEAREGMAAAALIAGMAFANSGLGAAHGVGMAIGIAYHIPHGEACGTLLPHVMKLNKDACLGRMAKIGEVLTGKHFPSEEEAAQAAVDFVFKLAKDVHMNPDFKHLNIPREEIPAIAKGSYGTSMTSNPVQLDQKEMEEFVATVI